MADVFISYKSDRRAAAEHLAEILADHGYSVWWDYALVSGRDFGQQIERQIREAKAVVVLWCSLSRDSEWVKEEAALAKRLDKIVPVQIEAIELPLGFSMAQTIDLSAWDGSPRSAVLDGLLRDIARLVGRPPVLNQEGLNRTERAWRRFGGPPLRDFELIDALERRRPARTFPESLRRTETDLPTPPIEHVSGAEATNRAYLEERSWRTRAAALWSLLRTATSAIPADIRAWPSNSPASAAVVGIGLLAALAVGIWLGQASRTDTTVRAMASPTSGARKPPPAGPTNPPAGSLPTLPAAPSVGVSIPPPPGDVRWNVCNKSSRDKVWAAVGYLDDEDLDTGFWTYRGWFAISKSECVLVARTKNTHLLVRADSGDGVTWGRDNTICVLKTSNYLVRVAGGETCPSDYETRQAFSERADKYGPHEVSLTD
jgi:uncharacterized membrane protein